MPNKKNINKINLKEFVDSLNAPARKSNFFDLTKEIMLEERPGTGMTINRDGDDIPWNDRSWTDHASSYYDEVIQQGSEFDIPLAKLGRASQRLYSSIKREADKDFARDSNSIKQGVERIQGNDRNLPFLRKYFSMYGKVCYNSLVATENQDFQRPVYTDPGVYCLDSSIDKAIVLWVKKYDKKVKKLLLKAKGKQSEAEHRKKIFKLIFDNFISLMNSLEVVSKNNIMVSEQKKDYLIEQLSDTSLGKFNKKFTPDFLMGACVLLFEPVFATYSDGGRGATISEGNLLKVSVSAASDVLSQRGINNTNFSSFLSYNLPMDFVKNILDKKKGFKKSWYAYTANLTFDPYGEKSYDSFWKNKPFKSFYPSATSDAKDFGYYEMGVTISSQLAGGAIGGALALKLINKLESVRKKTKRLKDPRTRGIFVTAGIITAGTYSFIDPHGIFDIKKHIAESIAGMVKELGNAYWLYRKEMKSAKESKEKSVQIKYKEIANIENRVEKHANTLVLQIDSTMRTVLGHAMEDEEINMKTKNKLAQTFSHLIELVHGNFHHSHFSLTIPGKGEDSTVTQEEILTMLREIKDTVGALQVLEKLVNGEYGTSEQERAIKKSEIKNLSHLAKQMQNSVNPEALKQLISTADQIRYNRALFFNTVLRAPDYAAPEEQKESTFYPSEVGILIEDSSKEAVTEQGNVDYQQQVETNMGKMQAEIEFWAPVIKKIFGKKAMDSILTFEDPDDVDKTSHTNSLDIEANLKNTTIPKLRRIKNKIKSNSDVNQQIAVSEFNEWYRAVFQEETPRLYYSKEEYASGIKDERGNLKEKLRFGILDSQYFRKQPGLKSRAASIGRDQGYPKYLFILIGALNNSSHTMMFFDSSTGAKDRMKKASEYKLSASGTQLPAKTFDNGYDILDANELDKTNFFAGFNEELKNQFFEKFKETRQVNMLVNPPDDNGATKPMDTVLRGILGTLPDDTLDDLKKRLKDVYSRFVLLNNYIESLGLLVGWNYVLSKYSRNKNENLQKIKVAAAQLHKINLSGPTDRNNIGDEVGDYWESIRANGAAIIASIDYNTQAFQLLNSLFSRYEMNYANYINPAEWWPSKAV